MKALIVEDKIQLADAIRDYLKMNTVDAVTRYDGQEGYEEAATGLYDVIVLDLMLPNKDGVSIIRDLRANQIDTPIIVLTAKSSTDDKVESLLTGADDYMTKPFVLEELLARLYVVTRRKGQLLPNEVAFGDVSLDRLNHTLKKDGKDISLSLKEFQIIELLMTSGDKITEKSYLIDKVWGNDSESYYNSAEVYVTFLRRKLNSLGSKVQIRSIRNVGYKLVVEE